MKGACGADLWLELGWNASPMLAAEGCRAWGGPFDPVCTVIKLYGDQAIAYCNEHSVGSIVGVQLAQYGADVILNRLLADAQDVGDPLV